MNEELEERLRKKKRANSDAKGINEKTKQAKEENAGNVAEGSREGRAEEEISNAILVSQLIKGLEAETESGTESSFLVYDKLAEANDPNPIYLGASFVDYDEIFDYLGKMETKNSYQSFEGKFVSKLLERQEIEHTLLTEQDTQQAVKAEKYFTSGFLMTGHWGMVPLGGMSSEKWEAYKLRTVLEPHMVQIRWKING